MEARALSDTISVNRSAMRAGLAGSRSRLTLNVRSPVLARAPPSFATDEILGRVPGISAARGGARAAFPSPHRLIIRRGRLLTKRANHRFEINAGAKVRRRLPVGPPHGSGPRGGYVLSRCASRALPALFRHDLLLVDDGQTDRRRQAA